MLDIILLIILIFGLAFRLRLIFFKVNRFPTALYSDEVGHRLEEKLLHIKDINKYLKEHFFFRTRLGYPNLYHQFLKFLSNKISLKKGRIFSGIFALLFVPIFYVINMNYLPLDKIVFILIAITLSLATFGFFVRQHIAYTARSFADFILFVGYSLIIVFHNTSEPIYFILATIIFSMVWFSSEFGIQSLILNSILWVVISGNTLPLEVTVYSLVLALLLNRNKVKNILLHKLAHWIWYSRNSQFLYKNKIESFNLNSLKEIYQYLTNKIFIQKFLQFIPFAPLFFILAIVSYKNNSFESAFIISTMLIGIVTTYRTFSFLGPGFRYMLYTIPFCWQLLYEFDTTVAYILLFVEISISLFIVISVLKHDKADEDENELSLLFEIVDKKDNTIISSPILLVESILSKGEEAQAIYYSHWDCDFEPKSMFTIEKNVPVFPYLTNESEILLNIKKEFNINIFVIDKKNVSSFFKEENPYNEFIKSKKIIYESERFLVVEL